LLRFCNVLAFCKPSAQSIHQETRAFPARRGWCNGP